MPNEAEELVQHIHDGLRDEIGGHLRVGWAIARIVESRIYETEGTLAAWVKRHLPIGIRTAELRHKNWQIIRTIIEADSHPILPEEMLNWVAIAQRVAQARPILTSEKALAAMTRLLGCESETVVKVWARAESIARKAGKTQVQAPHVHAATAEVIAPEITPSPDVPSETEDNGEPPEPAETDEQARHRRAVAMLPSDCPTTELIPDVAAAMCNREVLRKIARDIQTSRRHLDQLRDDEVTAYLHIDEAKSFLQSAYRMIVAATAYAPCPYCAQKGRLHGGCKVCVPPGRRKPLGWVPRLRYKMSPDDLKGTTQQ